MTDFSNLNKTEIKDILKNLKLLNSLKKSLWNRWDKEYKRIQNWQNSYTVEYFDFWDEVYIRQNSLTAFKKLFWIDVKVDEINFISNKDLKWWFRIFLNDNMFDLSYKRFESLLK
jgi:hypothetical protein